MSENEIKKNKAMFRGRAKATGEMGCTLSFGWAIEQLRAGKMVTRKSNDQYHMWVEGSKVLVVNSIDDDKIYHKWEPTFEEIFAVDWQLFDE